ncbi:serine/threonine-protein phosphatase 5 [Histomonas meleagridis]|uniref:serine/threonine-protein phosphatase 5 n=1 Tax=Histomonas meleagridis TaxID=135588 RepID=UPI003559AD30|nr:serine/threonine-protein phosphatase 5 [Histomonas meleagridis]KAH0801348.1 serine/threonine-protein phosphatase 5 [Histomonas meleagridis]
MGNKFFRVQQYFKAHAFYNAALRSCPPEDKKQLSIIYSNLSATQLNLERTSEAIASATESIELDPENVKSYIRRGDAYARRCNWKEAYDDYLSAAKLQPNEQYHRRKMEFVKQKLLSSKMKKALSFYNLRNSLKEPLIPIEDETTGTVFDKNYAMKIMSEMINDTRPTTAVVQAMINKICEINRKLPNIVNIEHVGTIRIVGDTHGQFQDLINIFETHGYPSAESPYLFNGDYVDRGSMGIEILLTLFAWKLSDPRCIYMNRGNHETRVMNAFYGFENECKFKYSQQIFDALSDLFNTLPLGHIINDKILIVHGGLFSDQSVTIEKIQAMNRFDQPPDSGPLNDILWSDPMEQNGFAPSMRGVTRTFGPDVTAEFLEKNNLEILVRSHQVQEDGYGVMHNGKCITVFSAPNYIGQMGNKGAICRFCLDENGDYEGPFFDKFDAQPIPKMYPPMKFAQSSLF